MMITGMEDFSQTPAIIQFIIASALVVPGFFYMLIEQRWFFAFAMFFGGSIYLIGSVYLLEWISRTLFKKPYWALMLMLLPIGAGILFFMDYSIQMIGVFAVSGLVMNLFMWVYGYPVVRTHYTMRSLKWLSFKKGLDKQEYEVLCREKCGKFLYHPIAFILFNHLVSHYDYKGKTWEERLNDAGSAYPREDEDLTDAKLRATLGGKMEEGMFMQGKMFID